MRLRIREKKKRIDNIKNWKFTFIYNCFLFQEEDQLKCIVGLGVCDGILQKREMSVDGQPFHLVHKEKLQRLWTIATLPIVITEQDAARR